ncbi:hypothetical protein PspLS_08143 [Pyricularia sp. CBS 133598]|nr:hypothetical protein PspLS_08143 [Pyricularia sp. CBS 133598]
MYGEYRSQSHQRGNSPRRPSPRHDSRDYYRSRNGNNAKEQSRRAPERGMDRYHSRSPIRDRRRDYRGEYHNRDELQYDDDDDGQGQEREQGEWDESEDRGRQQRRRRSFSDGGGHDGRSGRSLTPVSRPGPSNTLILEGLPMDVNEDDILDGFDAFTNSSRFASDQIRAVRLRTNKLGRRICFVEFFSVNDAEDFIERHNYRMSLDLPVPGRREMESVQVSVNYSRNKEDGGGGEGRWTCAHCAGINYSRRVACYKCGRDEDDSGAGPILTGETDEAPAHLPSQYLVVRDLEGSITEEVLAKGITKLFIDESKLPKEQAPPAKKLKSTAPVGNTTNLGAKPGSLRRVFLMRDRRTNESWRYGFAEFRTLEDAQAAAAKFRASPKFTISSKPVTVGFIHTGVFVPVLEADDHDSPPTAFVPVYNREVKLKYWDSRAYPSIYDVNREASPEPTSPEGASPEKPDADSNATVDANGKRVKKSKDKEKEKAIAMAPQMQMWAKKRAELHRAGVKPGVEGFVEMELDSTGEGEQQQSQRRAFGPRAKHDKDTYISYGNADDMTCLLCMRRFTTAQDLRDHEVLSQDHASALQDADKVRKATARLERVGKKPETVVRRTTRDRSDPAPIYTSYADPDAICCMLCRRRFKGLATLRLHERESELHRTSLRDEKRVEQAVIELVKLGKTPIQMRPKESGNQYRDRARERRKAFGPSTKAKSGQSQPKKDGVKKEEAAPKEKQPSKGAALLSKMGWTAGQGLGADGSGRAEAIRTEMYRPGVGLGAEGGKVGDAAEAASRNTKGVYDDFVKVTKDKARERFEKLE